MTNVPESLQNATKAIPESVKEGKKFFSKTKYKKKIIYCMARAVI